MSTVQVLCNNGHYFFTNTWGGKIDPSLMICDECGEEVEVIPILEIKDPVQMISAIEIELEDRNCHQINDLPRKLYNAIAPMVDKRTRFILSQKIAAVFLEMG